MAIFDLPFNQPIDSDKKIAYIKVFYYFQESNRIAKIQIHMRVANLKYCDPFQIMLLHQQWPTL